MSTRRRAKKSTGLPVVHPDTIPGLAPDCRRVLRDDYMVIQAAQQARPQAIRVERMGRGQWAGIVVGFETRYVSDDGAVARAVAEYRRTAQLWGVDVEARS